MANTKLEEIRKIITSMERLAESGQSLARDTMGKEPGQRTQNNKWRYILQDLKDLKKVLGLIKE